MWPFTAEKPSALSNKGLMEILSHEGVSTKPYLDEQGIVTIGPGLTKSDIPDLDMKYGYMSPDESIGLLKERLTPYENAVKNYVKADLSQEQFDALTSVAYNIGVNGFKKSTFVRKINEGASNEDISNALMMWTKQKDLKPRRQKEIDLYTSGKYSNNGKTLLFDVDKNGKPSYKHSVELNINDVVDN